jgi:hypothetical protein
MRARRMEGQGVAPYRKNEFSKIYQWKGEDGRRGTEGGGQMEGAGDGGEDGRGGWGEGNLLENRCDELGIFKLRDFAKRLKPSNRKKRDEGGRKKGARRGGKEERREGGKGCHERMAWRDDVRGDMKGRRAG